MAWKIEFDEKAKKEFKKLDKAIQKQIDKFIMKLMKCVNPRHLGKGLRGSLHSFWRYRVGDYRLICNIEDKTVTIFVLRVSHRREVYKNDV